MRSILYVCSEPAPGMLPFASSIISTMALSGQFEVFVLAVNDGKFTLDNLLNNIPSQNITFIESPKSKISRTLFKLYPLEIWNQVKILSQKHDISDIHLLTGEFFLFPFRKRIQERFRVFYTVHDLIPHERKTKNNKEKIITKYISYATKRYVALYNNLITSSLDQYNELKKSYPEKNVFFHEFPSLITPAIIEGEESCPELDGIKNYILFFGQLDFYKGVETLYNIFTREYELKKEILVIAGKGDYYFQKKIDDSNVIRLNRYILDEEIKSLFENAKCVVFPYLSATQSGVLSLAYFFEVPLLASAISYFESNVISGKTGYLFTPGDEQSLTTVLSNILERKDYSEMKKEQKNYFREKYSQNKLLKELLCIYKSEL